MSQIKRVIVPEISEVKLIDSLAIKIGDWAHNFRFTMEKNTDLDVSDDDKNVSPQIFKFYFPKREHREVNIPPGARSLANIPTPDSEPLFPAIIIRPTDGSSDLRDDGVMYEDVNIDICVFVNEFNVEYRYTALLLAKKVLLQHLRSLPKGILDFAYRLQNSSNWKIFDDSQDPKASLVITTTWRCFVNNIGQFNLNELD